MPPLPAPTIREPAKQRCAVAHAWLSAGVYAKLEIAAASRGTHPDKLAAFIIENVLRGAEHNGFLEIS